MKAVYSILTILVVTIFLAPSVLAQDLVIEQRQISVGHDAVYDLLGDDIYMKRPTEVARRLFAMPIDDFVKRQGQDVEVTNTKIYIKDNLVRMGDGSMYTIINTENGSIQYVNSVEQTYMEWTQKDTEEMEAKMNAAMESAGFSAEDLENLKNQMMEKAGDDADGGDEYDDESGGDEGEAVGTGKTKEINGMKATSHESNTFDVVTVTWCSQANADVMNAFKNMAAYSLLVSDDEDGEDEEACGENMQVLEQTYNTVMNSYSIDEMLSVRQESVSDDLFRVPAGYSKQKSPF